MPQGRQYFKSWLRMANFPVFPAGERQPGDGSLAEVEIQLALELDVTADAADSSGDFARQRNDCDVVFGRVERQRAVLLIYGVQAKQASDDAIRKLPLTAR